MTHPKDRNQRLVIKHIKDEKKKKVKLQATRVRALRNDLKEKDAEDAIREFKP